VSDGIVELCIWERTSLTFLLSSSHLYTRLSISTATRARALYDYTGTSPEEASFTADEEVLVVDREDGDWWRIDAGDVVKIAPATYLEVIG